MKQNCTSRAHAGVMITTCGQRHLGAALGDRTFVRKFVVEKVTGWVKEMERLATIARVQPQASHTVSIYSWADA